MKSLLLYKNEESKFDKLQIISIFRAMDGSDLIVDEPSDFCTVKCHFTFESDKTIVRLSEDCKAIEIEGTGVASWRAAWVIQQQVLESLHLIDSDYSFDILIRKYRNFKELRGLLEKD